MEFSLKMEAISIVITLILLLYDHGEKGVGKKKDRWFSLGLVMSLVSTCVNVLSTWAIRYYAYVPLWLNVLLASLYFVYASITTGVIALYIFTLVYKHIPDKHGLRVVYRVNIALLVLIVALTIINLFNGCIFYFQDGEYCRGTLNWFAYAAVGVEILMAVVCVIKNRDMVNRDVNKMIRLMPIVATVVVAFQLAYRNIMMNGMMMAIMNVILFISFQQIHLGVDSLTGLGNREAFVEELTNWTATKSRFHVVFMNLREFRRLNQNLGQAAGDEALYLLGEFLRTRPVCARIYRLGSVNFAILCDNDACEHVGRCIEAIQERLKKPWEVEGASYQLSACFSDLLWEGQPWSSAQIIDRLEYTMEIAKAQGDDSHVTFDGKIDVMMERQKYIIEQLKWATKQQAYEVYYQPIYCWRDEVFCSAEALVRLRDKQGSMIPPGEFIPIAEKTGMIRDITWIVAEKVCSFLSAHRELGLKAVSINLSRQQFMDDDMQQRLEELIRRYDIDPHMLKVEVTEGTIAKNPQRTELIMTELVEKGVGFYLDDFGTGYSNFSSVMRLPLETIKLDKSVTDKILSTEKIHRFVGDMVRMFVDAGYSVVAEGAENEETVSALKKLGVDRIQGFYYARPMPERDFVAFLSKNNFARE